ncbi:MAG: hypothetical protein V1875_07795, partial [Candidatus Altiarchaeota archaeon]
LSPTNPDYSVNLSWEEIIRTAAKAFHETDKPWKEFKARLDEKLVDEQVQAGLRRLYFCTKKGPQHLLDPPFDISTRVVFGLATLFPDKHIITKTDEPYIRKQFIGSYPDCAHPGETYQILHDDNGPIWHQTQTYADDFEQPERSLAQVITSLYSNLAADGCLLCSQIQLNTGQLKRLNNLMAAVARNGDSSEKRRALELKMKVIADEKGYATPTLPERGDIIILENPKTRWGHLTTPFIFAKSESPIAKQIRAKLKLRDDGGLHIVDDLYAVIDVN